MDPVPGNVTMIYIEKC